MNEKTETITTYILKCRNLEEVKVWTMSHPNHFDIRQVGNEYLGWRVKDANTDFIEIGLEDLINSKIVKSWYRDDTPLKALIRQ